MYLELPPGPRTTHGLSRFLSRCPESTLEKFHEAVAHFANSGMKPSLSDCLTLCGTAEHNVQCRHKAQVREARGSSKRSDVPQYLEGVPLFWNHSMLHYLNLQALQNGLSHIFESIQKLGKNNGKVFLSKYFQAQKTRNVKYGQDQGTSKCTCPDCTNISWPLVTQSHALPAQEPATISNTPPMPATKNMMLPTQAAINGSSNSDATISTPPSHASPGNMNVATINAAPT